MTIIILSIIAALVLCTAYMNGMDYRNHKHNAVLSTLAMVIVCAPLELLAWMPLMAVWQFTVLTVGLAIYRQHVTGSKHFLQFDLFGRQSFVAWGAI